MDTPQKVPFLVVSDAPNCPTGLGRIARDLTSRLHEARDLLGIDVHQLGVNYDGSPWPWRVYPLYDVENWGERDIARTLGWVSGGKKAIIFTVWDPSRCYPITQQRNRKEPGKSAIHPATEFWGYFAVDGNDPNGGFGGPAGAALKSYERILGYGKWGAGVLKATTLAQGMDAHVEYLPHGIETDAFSPFQESEYIDCLPASLYALRGKVMVGCVASNQARKDWGLFFQTMSLLRREFPELQLWAHVDFHTKTWSIPGLADLFGFNNSSLVVTQEGMSDLELAGMYSMCSATFAPGLGEGFGYPIVESLACGTPVVHGAYGGGTELIPRGEWIFPPIAARLEGPYSLIRPVYEPSGALEATLAAVAFKQREGETGRAYCAGSVAHLDWKQLWPRWLGWFRRGVEDFRGRTE